MAGVIIITSCKVHGVHLLKFRRGQLLKNIPAVQSEKHEQTKDRIHLCLYFTDNEKPTLCIAFFSPPYYFMKTAAFPPPPHRNAPRPNTAVFGVSFSLSFRPPIFFCSLVVCMRHLCPLLPFPEFGCPIAFKSVNK